MHSVQFMDWSDSDADAASGAEDAASGAYTASRPPSEVRLEALDFFARKTECRKDTPSARQERNDWCKEMRKQGLEAPICR